MNTKWKFVEPDENGNDVWSILTEEEIFEKYWPFWYHSLYKDMDNKNTNIEYLRLLPLAKQKRHCIDEYIIIHWGNRVE